MFCKNNKVSKTLTNTLDLKDNDEVLLLSIMVETDEAARMRYKFLPADAGHFSGIIRELVV